MVNEWAGTGQAYAQSFERQCAGAVGALLDALPTPTETQVGNRLLDVGTGPGTVIPAAFALGWDVTAVDAEPSMVEVARHRHPSLDITVAALPHLPFVDGAFDAVTANFVVGHLADPAAGIRELARVTRAGGAVGVTTWPSLANPVALLWNEIRARAGAATPEGQRLPPERDFARTPEGLAALLVGGGLAQVRATVYEWDFAIEPEALWRGVEGGIASIGATYLAQDVGTRAAMLQAYADITRGSETLHFPMTAIVAAGNARRR